MKKPIDMMMDGVQWVPVEGDDKHPDSKIPIATHQGILEIGPLKIECFRLDNGMAVISEKGMMDFLTWLENGAEGRWEL